MIQGPGGFGSSPPAARPEVRASERVAGDEAKRLRIHQFKIFQAPSAEELELAVNEWFRPGDEPDGTERREQREALYPPSLIREGGTWYAVVIYTE